MSYSDEDYKTLLSNMKSKRAQKLNGVKTAVKVTAVPVIYPDGEEPPKEQTVVLPYPPSLNAIYRVFAWLTYVLGKPKARGRLILSDRARKYKEEVNAVLVRNPPRPFRPNQRLELEILAFPPDRRKRDIANLEKLPIDTLEEFGVMPNDEQIDRVVIERRPIYKGGQIIVTLKEIGVKNA